MAVNEVNSAEYISGLQQGSNPSGSAPSQELGQAEFLLLLTTQLKNQDPSKPVDPSNFVSDLTEMSQLESTNKMSSSIKAMVAGFQAMQTMEASSLIGKSIQTSGTELSHTAERPTDIKLSLDKPLSDVTVVISDADGVVKEMIIGDLSKGDEVVSWDGKDDSGIVKGTGQYTVTVFGTDEKGDSISIKTVVPARINGISIGTDGSTTLILATGKKIPMSSVTEISL